MDLHQIYWSLKVGRPKNKATIYDIRQAAPDYIKKPVFFLSTGRCGTKWFSDLLSKDSDLAVFHDPVPSLASQSKAIHEDVIQGKSALMLEGNDIAKEIIWSARENHFRYSYKAGKRYIETNNYITFFAPILNDLFPDAKFVHLVRHPGEYIRSGVSRNYYSGSARDLMRPVPKIGVHADKWDNYSSIEKVAWLWAETNRFIDEFSQKVSAKKSYCFNINKQDAGAVEELFDFLNISMKSSVIKRALPRKKNVQTSHSIATYKGWEENEIQKVEQICGDLLEKYNYQFK